MARRRAWAIACVCGPLHMRRNYALLVLVLPVLTLLTTVALAFSLQREEHTLFSSALWRTRRLTPARAVPPHEQDPVQAMFEAAIELCEKRVDRRNYGRNDVSLAGVPKLLNQVFDADAQRMQSALESRQTPSRAERLVHKNVTCVCPTAGVDGQQLFDDSLLTFQALQTIPGRQCDEGACSPACSRVIVRGFASADECDALRERVRSLMPPLHEEGGNPDLTLHHLARSGDVRTTLLFLRLLERLRRAVAHEYGLPLSSVWTETAFVNRVYYAAQPLQFSVHADESSNKNFHYSAVLHLSSKGDGFEGGDFVFTDPAVWEADGGRSLQRLSPLKGRAMIFSSGWENVHYVDRVTSGLRFALPAFFRTSGDSPRADGSQLLGQDLARDVCGMWDPWRHFE